MHSIVSLCEITHHGLHEWNGSRGGGRIEGFCMTVCQVCVYACASEELGRVDVQIVWAALCVCVCV